MNKMQDKVSLLLVFLTLNFEMDFVNPQRYEPKEVPVFDEHLPSVSTVQQGDTAYLNCRIFNAENMSVSWIRGSDSHIITVDQETFISDQRFASLIKTSDNLWTLKIKYVSARDAGSYECQVSTVPKMSRKIELVVVVPKVRIFGGPDIYVKEHSSLQLECVISATIVSPKYVVWEHNGHLVPGTSVIKVQDSPSTSSSTLSIGGVTRYQAGNYSCHPDNLHPARVTLHVLSKDGQHLPVTTGTAAPSPHQTLKIQIIFSCYNFTLLL